MGRRPERNEAKIEPDRSKYKVIYGLAGQPGCCGAVNGANTVEDLQRYLNEDPEPEYRLVSVQFLPGQNYLVTWEKLAEPTTVYMPCMCGGRED
jgi:hypothetical protein